MKKLGTNIDKSLLIIKKKLGNSPDFIIKKRSFNNYKIAILFNESLISSKDINDFILEPLTENNSSKKITNISEYLMTNIPATKTVEIDNYDNLILNLLSGFTVILIDNYPTALGIETKTSLDSGIAPAINEKTLKGPKDAFTENYQVNIGLIRKRLKYEKLMLFNNMVGNIGKSKVGIMYIEGIANSKFVDKIINKIENISIDAVFDLNQIVEIISENENNVIPNFLTTERPDYAAMQLLDGKIVIVLENTPFVAVIPAFITDFFHTPEDMYNRTINASINRIIRFVAFLLTILTPALYIALTTYNHETIPEDLIINLSIQRDGVPFSTIFEAILMILTFEILKETDLRTSSKIGSSLSIVGSLILGSAAVSAGIVSPIMVIIIAITAISGLIVSHTDFVNGFRWWRIMFLIGASVAGVIGIVVVSLIFVTNLVSIKSFGIPFSIPFSPFTKKNIGNSVIISFYHKYFKRNSVTSTNDKRIERKSL